MKRAALPAARRGDDRAGVVLEEPAGEVAAGPAGGAGDAHARPARPCGARSARISSIDIRWSATSASRDRALVAWPRRRARRARRRRSASAARTPVSSAWPMPSPVIGSVAAAASPTKSVRRGGRARCRRPGPGSARPGGATRARVGAEHVGDVRPGSAARATAAFMSCTRPTLPPSRWMPKPTLARPSGSGNDQA